MKNPFKAIFNKLSGPQELEEIAEYLRAGGVASSGVNVSFNRARSLAAVASCVRVLSDDVAQLPLVLYRKEGDRRIPAADKELYKILKSQPNEWQTAFEWRRDMARSLLLRGNAYSYVTFGVDGFPIEVLPLQADRVEVEQRDNKKLVYTYRVDSGKTSTFDQRNILHIRGPSEDGVKGLSPVSLHRETIGDGIAAQEYGSRFFSNGAKPGGLLQSDAKVPPESKKAIREDFERMLSEQNAHRIAVVDQGVKFQPLSISPEDAQYIEGRKFNRSEICGLYGVPPHRIGDLDNATFSNIENQNISYVYSGLMPHLVNIEQAIERDLIPEDGYYAKHKVDALLRGDARSRAEALQIQRRNGIISANEWREMEDLNPRGDKGGDEYIIEANMQRDDGEYEDAGTDTEG